MRKLNAPGGNENARAALAEAEEAEKLGPDRPAARILHARALEKLGKPEEAFQAFSAAQKLDPRSFAVLPKRERFSDGVLLAVEAAGFDSVLNESSLLRRDWYAQPLGPGLSLPQDRRVHAHDREHSAPQVVGRDTS